jgi:carboxypeptidase Taq
VAAAREEAFAALRERAADLHHLAMTALLLGWDQRTMMPPAGTRGRSGQLGTLAKLGHELLVSEETARLLEATARYEGELDYDSDDASLVRFLRHEHERARRVPSKLRGEMIASSSRALSVWDHARANSDFESFRPYLERNFELRREYVDALGEADEPYDHLLDDFEPGMKTAEVRAVLAELRDGLVPLIGEIAEREPVDDSILQGEFPIEAQRELERRILDELGYDPESWRLDETVHPFEATSCITDVRITTRHRPTDLHSLFSTLHEFGHGLYERQVSLDLEDTPLARGCSYAFHESQSRLWENLVGRSLPFWRRFYPELQEVFPSFAGIELEDFYRAINAVRPSTIRIDADEATYNLHIILRFELEQELLADGGDMHDLPERWDAKMRDYLGVEVPDVAEGVLQDMHWAGGHIGYFSTYSLGNIVSCQLWERIRAELPDLDRQLERGEFGALRDWLGEHVHRHGRKFLPRELLERVVGGSIDPQPYLRYLRAKLGAIYGLE